jgi:hypothetical protein
LAGETIKDKLLDAEIVACCVLLAYILLAWIGGNTSNDNKWKAAGFVAMIGGDLICTLLWLKWDGARHWYWTGAIAAYLIWAGGPLKTLKLEKKVQEQIEFGRFLIAEDRNPVENRMVM